MNDIKKAGSVTGRALVLAEELPLINAQSLRELSEEEVFAFRVCAADDRVDRDFERFPPETLRGLAPLFVGRTMIMDHVWSAAGQTARIYAADVEQGADGVSRLILRAYMLRLPATESAIAAIEGGILREVSVGCAIGKAVCSVCGADKRVAWCEHRPGAEYDGKTCHVDLCGAEDAYEVSFVAVPAQRAAGVVKQYGGEDKQPQEPPEGEKDPSAKALALLELEII